MGLTATAERSEASLETEVDRYLQPYLDTGNFSGSVLIARGGEILLSKAYGSASLEHGVRNAPKTVFHLASVSASGSRRCGSIGGANAPCAAPT